MTDERSPELRTIDERVLIGSLHIYRDQAEAARLIPQQWCKFLEEQRTRGANAPELYGASPCTNDGHIHYLTGVLQTAGRGNVTGEHLTVEAGEYAVTTVNDPAMLRDTWVWLLSQWLPTSGREERHAPEFERFTDLAPDGTPIGPVELWIPLRGIVAP